MTLPKAVTRERRRQRKAALIQRLKKVQDYQLAIVNSQLLDEAKKVTGSDWKTAQRIGTNRQKLSDIRKARRRMSPAIAARLANLLNRNVYSDVLHALHQSGRTPKSREFWLNLRSGIWQADRLRYENWSNDHRKKEYPTWRH